jgi:N-acetylglucosaminyldiphosphoundecaprenol N-acetyl-beta-D-mannosaminyltransferase
LGLPLDLLTLEEAAREVEGLSCGAVVTLNPEMAVRARRNERLRQMIESAARVVADGAGICWAARLLHRKPVPRVSGIDLLERILANGKRRVFLIGATSGAIKAAAENIRAAYPNALVAGYHHGYFDDWPPVFDQVRHSGADFVAVGMGVPKQEEFIFRLLADQPGLVAMGVGGAFDVLARAKRRAPLWARQAGLEWLFRVIAEPSRIPRFVSTHPAFVYFTLKERLKTP